MPTRKHIDIMPRYRRSKTAGGCYFFTQVAYKRQAIFCDDAFRQALRESIQAVNERHPFQINAWVLLPDHMHTMWTLPQGDSNYSLRWQQIKKKVTYQIKSRYETKAWISPSKVKYRESTIWQRRFYGHEIRSEEDYKSHMNYCHYNPVRHGLVMSVKDWEYSTFHRLVRAGIYEKDWGINGGVDLKCAGEPV